MNQIYVLFLMYPCYQHNEKITENLRNQKSRWRMAVSLVMQDSNYFSIEYSLTKKFLRNKNFIGTIIPVLIESVKGFTVYSSSGSSTTCTLGYKQKMYESKYSVHFTIHCRATQFFFQTFCDMILTVTHQPYLK